MDGRILIIEDDELIRLVLSRAAHAAGLSVVEAADGPPGFAAALAHDIDLILLDIKMPRMDGRDLLNLLKKDPRTADIPVLICSGRDDEHSRRTAIELGASDFIGKPFNATTLMIKVGRLIDKARERKSSTH